MAQWVSEWRVLPGSRTRPSSMWKRLLFGILGRCLSDAAHRAVWELYILGCRTVCIARTIPLPRLPRPIPSDPRLGHLSLDFALVCSEGIRTINQEYGLGSYLDRQIYCRAFVEGVEFAYRTERSAEGSEDRQREGTPSGESIRPEVSERRMDCPGLPGR
jgi:hypothetical protein